MEELVFGIDVRTAGDGVADDDGHHLLLDELHHGLHEVWFLDLVGIQPAHQVLPGMTNYLAGQRQIAQLVKGARIEFQRALILQLFDDVVLHQFQRRLGVDEVVMEDRLQRDQRVVGLLFEDLVAIARQFGVEVGGTLFPEFAEPGTPDLLIVREDFLPAFELPCDALSLIDEEDHDVENGLLEMRGLGCFGKITAQADHLVEQHFQALHLHLRAREAVEDRAVLLIGFEQLADENAHHFAVAHHAALGLEFLRFRTVEQGAHHDRLGCDAAHFANEIRVCAFASTWSAAEQDQLLWEAQVCATVIGFELFPHVVEDELGIFDFQVCWRGGFGREVGGGGRHGVGLFQGVGLAKSRNPNTRHLASAAPCHCTAFARSLSQRVNSSAIK